MKPRRKVLLIRTLRFSGIHLHGRGGRSQRKLMRSGSLRWIIDQIPQFFAGFKIRNTPARQLEFFAGLGVACNSRFSVTKRKAAEAPYFNSVPPRQRRFDTLKYLFSRRFDVIVRHVRVYCASLAANSDLVICLAPCGIHVR